ncbi:DNA polymerase III subunit beta [Rhodococcoides fascians]|uniref:DNA polymerase III subunit beta n=1 Tax=Rhodococcoides fascians TaxID=1828 RepID=UPI00055DE2E7|nr:DNA polymerase III subunit beta [Rhodococcus fascians]
MHITADRTDFANTITWVARTLPGRAVTPILGGILLTATDTHLTVAVFDYETSAEQTIPVDHATPGRVLVSGKLLADITKSLPNKPVDIRVDGNQVRITCGAAKFSLPTMPDGEYPALPATPAVTGSIPADLFTEAAAQVTVAASKDDTLPMLTGVRIDLAGDTITLASTDRFRLAVRTIRWDADIAEPTGVLVPAKAFAETAKNAGTGSVDVALGNASGIGTLGILGVTAGGKQTTTRLIDSEFPKFRQLIPASHTALASVNVAELSGAIKRVALMADRGAQVRLSFTADGLTLSAGGADAGEAEETLPAVLVGAPIDIAFNPGYLLDGLAALRSEQVTFGFTVPARPAVLRPGVDTDGREDAGEYTASETDFLYLLMPVRLPAA